MTEFPCPSCAEPAARTRDMPLPSLAERAEQAAKNARWWRREIAEGRIRNTPDMEYILRDLERAAGTR